MLRVIIEYFAKSLKITQGHWKWHHWEAWVYGFLFACDSYHGPILHHFRDKARCWSKIAIFFIPPAFDAPFGGGASRRNTTISFGIVKHKLEFCGYRLWKKFEDTITEYTNVTDGECKTRQNPPRRSSLLPDMTETMDIIDQKKEARLKGNHDEWKRLKGVYKARSKVDLELFTGN